MLLHAGVARGLTGSSQLVRVDDEAAVLRDFVVEGAPRVVGDLRLPVHATATGRTGGVVDGMNQTTAYAEAAQRGHREQVLEITDIVQACRAAMVEVVNEAHHCARLLRHERVHRLRGIEEALPGRLGDFLRERGDTTAPVEGVVAIPERAPRLVVGAADGPGLHRGAGHDFSSLKACVHSLCLSPGMHQSMHSGSMARAASTPPISSTSQPNWSSSGVMRSLALWSAPQMNIVGLPPAYTGSTMRALPTELSALTKRTCGNSRCSRSRSESSRVVKNFNTPFTGGASASGLVASITGLPARLDGPAARTMAAAAVPLTARTPTSANFAVSSGVATCAPGLFRAQSRSFSGFLEPTVTS